MARQGQLPDRAPDGYLYVRGHRSRPQARRRVVRPPDPEKLERDLQDLLKRYPVYRTDGTLELLREWQVYNPGRLRWFIRHCG